MECKVLWHSGDLFRIFEGSSVQPTGATQTTGYAHAHWMIFFARNSLTLHVKETVGFRSVSQIFFFFFFFSFLLDSFFQLFGDQLFQEADTTETSHHASSFKLIFRMDFPHHVEASTFFLLCFTKLLDSQITRKRHGAQAPSYALHKLGGQGRNVATPPQNPPVSKP